MKCVVHVAREYGGLAGAGGLKDVVEGLSKASAEEGIDTHVFLPFYRVIEQREHPGLQERLNFAVAMDYARQKRAESITIHSGRIQPHLTLHLIDTQRYRYLMEGDGTIERYGIYQYTGDEAAALGRPELSGKGYVDFFAMNVLMVKGALGALSRMEIKPDVIHCHDGHAALLPLIAQESREGFAPNLRYVPTVITVHNAGAGYHQEVADLAFAAAICGVPRRLIDGCLLNGSFDPLVAGGLFGGAINAVSENYARELQRTGQDWRTGWLGHALAGKGVELLGVTNGIDPESLNPEDPEQSGLAAGFSVVDGDLEGKEVCKKATLDAVHREDVAGGIVLHGTLDYREDVPLLTFIGRLDEQKGYDILADALQRLFEEDENVQTLGLGDGDPALVTRFGELAARFASRVCMAEGYSPLFARQVFAAGDFFVIPSRFEPCGLTDFLAQLAGNVPIVHRVGGLVKTLDGRFGFSYLGGAEELLDALRRALRTYRKPNRTTLRRIQVAAAKNIDKNFTWKNVLAKGYFPIYRDAIARTGPLLPY